MYHASFIPTEALAAACTHGRMTKRHMTSWNNAPSSAVFRGPKGSKAHGLPRGKKGGGAERSNAE